MINLNTKIAKFKFKKLGEINYSLWIMLIKPIQRAKLTFICMLYAFYCFLPLLIKFTISQMLHGCRSDIILNCLIYFKKYRNLYVLLDYLFKTSSIIIICVKK